MACAVFVALLQKVDDWDVFFYLLAGQRWLETLSVPRVEFYVAPLLGQPATFSEWGLGVVYELLLRLGGFWALSLGQALLLFSVLAVSWRAAVVGGDARHPAPVLAVVACWLWVQYRPGYRAEVVLFLALALTRLFVERYAAGGGWRALAWLPVVTMVQAWAHPSPLATIVFFFALAAPLAWARGGGELGRVAGVGVAALATSLLNPLGAEPLLAPVHALGQSDLYSRVTEFIPTLSTSQRWPFIALLVVATAAVVASRRPGELAVLLLFGALAFRHNRAVAPLAVVTLVPIARAAVRLSAALTSTRAPLWAATALALSGLIGWSVQQPRWGAGLLPGFFPIEGARRIAELTPGGTTFNVWQLGAWLRWQLGPGALVFIDGRHTTVDEAVQLESKVLQAAPGWEALLARHRVSSVMVPATLPYSGALLPLVARLAWDDRWLLTSNDAGTLTFVRADAVKAPPAVLPRATLWRTVAGQALATATRDGTQADAQWTLAQAGLALRDAPMTVRALTRYFELRPADGEGRRVMRQVIEGSLRRARVEPSAAGDEAFFSTLLREVGPALGAPAP